MTLVLALSHASHHSQLTASYRLAELVAVNTPVACTQEGGENAMDAPDRPSGFNGKRPIAMSNYRVYHPKMSLDEQSSTTLVFCEPRCSPRPTSFDEK